MFPGELMDQYRLAMVKFKKTQKALFRCVKKSTGKHFTPIKCHFYISRRFGPNLVEISDELGQVLAPKFLNSDLPEYAGLCWIAAGKCEQDLENKVTAIDFLIRAGNAFVQANERASELFPGSNSHEHVTSAVRCYNEALSLLGNDSAMSAGIVRKLKRICPNSDQSSQFHSPTHRIHDLEVGGRLQIREGRFLAALEQLTEIFDILQEEKTEESYRDTLAQVEVLILCLLLLLDLPPGRQSPIHMKALNKYSADNRNILNEKISPSMTDEYLLALQNLSCACDLRDTCAVAEARQELLAIMRQSELTCSLEQSVLLAELINKFLCKSTS